MSFLWRSSPLRYDPHPPAAADPSLGGPIHNSPPRFVSVLSAQLDNATKT